MINRDDFEELMNEAEPVVDALLNMDTEDRLIWRTELAEKGYEMTPMQVDQYMYILELARDSGFV